MAQSCKKLKSYLDLFAHLECFSYAKACTTWQRCGRLEVPILRTLFEE
jgi:hypothetical protein